MTRETRTVDVAIIGAGTAGLAARREVAHATDNYVVIDDGPLGTTCARVGCMPSKVLIQVANDLERTQWLSRHDLVTGHAVKPDRAAIMRHVRALRDRFVRGVVGGLDAVEGLDRKLLRGRAAFTSANGLTVTYPDGATQPIAAKRIVVATGSKPIVPGPFQPFADLLIDTDQFFELEHLPDRIAVIGLGVIGLELGQALHRLGVAVHAYTLDKRLGGLSDPAVQEEAFATLADELPVTLAGVDKLERSGSQLRVHAQGESRVFDRALLTMGRRPSTAGLNLEVTGAPLDPRGAPSFDSNTFQIGELPIYFAGDVNGSRPLLHEAADQGRIAGYNAVRDSPQCFRPRTPLAITFSEPNIAVVGASFAQLRDSGTDFVVGQVSYHGQGRAIVKAQERGRLHVYVAAGTGRLLGAELSAPDGEHLAHLLAWAIASGMTVQGALSMPFYHPVVEEGLRTALRDAAGKLGTNSGPLETLRCQDPPVGCWS